MLSKFDDYPIHQTPQPIAQAASSDRNVYDRYWFNGYDKDGDFYFGIGLGTYPNRGIMDCGFSIVRNGEQHAFHASRRAPAEPSETQVGPFRIEVREPMRDIRHEGSVTVCLVQALRAARNAGIRVDSK